MANSDRDARVMLTLTARAEDQARDKIRKTAVPMTPQLKKAVNSKGYGPRASRYEN